MPIYQHNEVNVVRRLRQEQARVIAEVERWKNQYAMTLPVWGELDLPDDLIEGQWWIGDDNSPRFYANGKVYVVLTEESSAADVPRAKMIGAGQIIATGTPTNVQFDDSQWDNVGSADIENDRLIARTSGTYMIVGRMRWSAHTATAGYRRTQITTGGATTIATMDIPATTVFNNDTIGQSLSVMQVLNVDEYVQLRVTHTQGADLTVGEATFSMYRFGEM